MAEYKAGGFAIEFLSKVEMSFSGVTPLCDERS